MNRWVRHASLRDLDAIVALESQFPSDRMSRRALRHLLRTATARVWVLTDGAGEVGGALVLLIRRGTRVARIYSLVVSHAWRRQGAARALVAVAEQAARTLGRQRIHLEVRVDNVAAQKLYQSMGYYARERLPAYYADGTNAIRLAKTLGDECSCPCTDAASEPDVAKEDSKPEMPLP